MTTIKLQIVEPWELAEEATAVLVADIVPVESADAETRLLRLRTPLRTSDREIEYLVASVRHDGTSWAHLVPGAVIAANAIGVSAEHATGPNPLDLSWWRGGGAFVVDIEVVDEVDEANAQ